MASYLRAWGVKFPNTPPQASLYCLWGFALIWTVLWGSCFNKFLNSYSWIFPSFPYYSQILVSKTVQNTLMWVSTLDEDKQIHHFIIAGFCLFVRLSNYTFQTNSIFLFDSLWLDNFSFSVHHCKQSFILKKSVLQMKAVNNIEWAYYICTDSFFHLHFLYTYLPLVLLLFFFLLNILIKYY